MRAADTPVLREADSTVRRELARLDLTDRGLNQATIFASLLVGNRCFQILNLRNGFSHEYNNRDIRNSADPGVANHLRVERQQSCWFFGITARRGFPVDETLRTVELAEGVDISDEFVVAWKGADHLHLQVLSWTANLDAIVLCETLEQMDALVNEAIPGFSFLVLEGSFAKGAPFLEKRR